MKHVFVACPIGGPNSPERRRSDKLLRHVIEPVCRELGLEAIRADKLKRPGRITDQVTDHLESAAVVLADLTRLNPNVMFELGVRVGTQRSYVLLAKIGQTLPFDLKDLRTIFYSLDLDGAERTRLDLKGQPQAVLAESADKPPRKRADNPVISDQDVELAAQSVTNYLERLRQRKGFTRVGFEGIRKWVNATYTDDLLSLVLHRYPDRFRQARLRGDKPGIALAGRAS